MLQRTYCTRLNVIHVNNRKNIFKAFELRQAPILKITTYEPTLSINLPCCTRPPPSIPGAEVMNVCDLHQQKENVAFYVQFFSVSMNIDKQMTPKNILGRFI